ncbi:MAG: hypothetical protein EOP51_34320, partial [Sphingobacteriales bacterium]
TIAGPVTYTVTYSEEDAITLSASNITLNSTGNASGTVAVSTSGSESTITISDITGDGTLGITIAAGTANDAAGNLAEATGPSTTFTVTPSSDLSATLTANPTTISSGDAITYTMTVTNNGPSTATNISLNIPLPAGLDVSNYAVVGLSSMDILGGYDIGTDALIITKPTLAAGTTATIVVNVPTYANFTGTIAATLTASSETADPNGDNNTASVSVTVKSNNADLSNFIVSSGTLDPAFDSNTTAYAFSVSNATTTITVTPTMAQAAATIKVKINDGDYADVVSGNDSERLALNVGTNTIYMLVTAEDGIATKTYTITVTRALPTPVITFAALDPATYGDADIELQASSDNTG